MIALEGRRKVAKKSRHVVPDGDFWAVKQSGSRRASSIHSTKSAAVEAAKKAAARDRSELVIHGKDGQIRRNTTARRRK